MHRTRTLRRYLPVRDLSYVVGQEAVKKGGAGFVASAYLLRVKRSANDPRRRVYVLAELVYHTALVGR